MIIGPSHVVRWQRLKLFFGIHEDFLGIGGLPIWHKIVQTSSKTEHRFILVGDFRFGNAYDITQDESDAYLVKKELISPEIDKLMFDKSLSSVENLDCENTRLVFWCLLIREYNNINSRKYCDKGTYRHPIWNLAEVEGRFKNAIQLSEVIKQDLDFLFIDSSNHPSIYGYYFLKKIYEGLSPRTALFKTSLIKKEFSSIFDYFLRYGYLISGTANTFRLIKDYLKRGILDMRKVGGFHIREADEALFSSYKFHKNLIYFAKDQDARPDEAALTFFDKAPYQNKLLIIKNSGKTHFYKSSDQQKPVLCFVMISHIDDEEIVGDIYNLIGLIQVLYIAMSLLSMDGILRENPYCRLKSIVKSVPGEQLEDITE